MPVSKVVNKNNDFSEITFDLDSYKNKGYLTHNFHSYPAKFIPHFPRIIIERLTKTGDTVLDPFCGSGTTLVEAKLLGRNSIGLDINPISLLISKCKTTPLTNEEYGTVDRITQNIQSEFKKCSQSITLSANYKIPKIFNIDLWFQKNVQLELAIIKSNIDTVENENAKNFLTTAFSAIITPISNQISDSKYASIDKGIKTGEAITKFSRKIIAMKKRLQEFSELAKDVSCKIYECSTLSTIPVKDNSVDLIVTSPPYANTYDYYLYHRHRMDWLGYDMKKPQAHEIGSRNKHSDNDHSIQSYLESMEASMREFYRVLRKNKYFVIVIGDAIKNKKIIKMDKEFIKIGEEIGFDTKQCFSYNLRKFSYTFSWLQKEHDKKGHIIIFKKD